MKAEFAYYTENNGKITFLRDGRKSEDIVYFVHIRLDLAKGSIVIPVPETIEGKPVTMFGLLAELPDDRPVPMLPEPLIRRISLPSGIRHFSIVTSIVRNGAKPDPEHDEKFGLFNGTEIEISPDNKKYRVFGQGIYNTDMTKLYHIFSPGETFSVPAEVQIIMDRAGCALKGMKKLIVPESTALIDKGAFEGCTDLEEADIKAKNIGNRAFYGCKSLTSLSLGELDACCKDAFAGGCGLDKILEKAYACCYELKKFQCKVDKSTGGYELSLECTEIIQPTSDEQSDPDKPSILGNSPFRGSKHLKRLIVSNTESIGYAAFAECDALNTLFIENAARAGIFAFISCHALYSAYLDCKELFDSAFNSCTSLEKVTLVNTEIIRGGVFSHCEKLKEIELPDTLRIIGNNAFYKTSIQRLVIPSSVEELGKEILSGGVLELISVNNTLKPSCGEILLAGERGVTIAVRSAETNVILYELDMTYNVSKIFSGSEINIEAYNRSFKDLNDLLEYNEAFYSARDILRIFPDSEGSAYEPLKRYVSDLSALNVLAIISEKDYDELCKYPYFDDIEDERFFDLTNHSAKQRTTEITAFLMQKLHERQNSEHTDPAQGDL